MTVRLPDIFSMFRRAKPGSGTIQRRLKPAARTLFSGQYLQAGGPPTGANGADKFLANFLLFHFECQTFIIVSQGNKPEPQRRIIFEDRIANVRCPIILGSAQYADIDK